MNDSTLQSWLALSLMPGMSTLLFNRLLKAFGSPCNVLSSELPVLKMAGIKPELVGNILNYQDQNKNRVLARKIEESLLWQDRNKQQTILSQESPLYPDLLRQIPDPPPLLYVKGDVKKLAYPQIAMVGSRNPGAVGRKNARRFARELSQAGYLVCSGLALGIDYESHCGALENKGSTLAVLGTGIDQIYPSQNRFLAEKIIENGALVSAFPLGTRPNSYNFPKRNRIISGLSHGTLVVEAAVRSGSLITARMALEQGREVFAIPGSIHSATTRGCHHLIKQGAKLVEKLEDIIEELEAFIDLAREKTPKSLSTTNAKVTTVEAARVLAEIDYEAVSIDNLIVSTGLDVVRISSLLMELEIKGLIQSVTGGYILTVP